MSGVRIVFVFSMLVLANAWASSFSYLDKFQKRLNSLVLPVAGLCYEGYKEQEKEKEKKGLEIEDLARFCNGDTTVICNGDEEKQNLENEINKNIQLEILKIESLALENIRAKIPQGSQDRSLEMTNESGGGANALEMSLTTPSKDLGLGLGGNPDGFTEKDITVMTRSESFELLLKFNVNLNDQVVPGLVEKMKGYAKNVIDGKDKIQNKEELKQRIDEVKAFSLSNLYSEEKNLEKKLETIPEDSPLKKIMDDKYTCLVINDAGFLGEYGQLHFVPDSNNPSNNPVNDPLVKIDVMGTYIDPKEKKVFDCGGEGSIPSVEVRDEFAALKKEIEKNESLKTIYDRYKKNNLDLNLYKTACGDSGLLPNAMTFKTLTGYEDGKEKFSRRVVVCPGFIVGFKKDPEEIFKRLSFILGHEIAHNYDSYETPGLWKSFNGCFYQFALELKKPLHFDNYMSEISSDYASSQSLASIISEIGKIDSKNEDFENGATAVYLKRLEFIKKSYALICGTQEEPFVQEFMHPDDKFRIGRILAQDKEVRKNLGCIDEETETPVHQAQPHSCEMEGEFHEKINDDYYVSELKVFKKKQKSIDLQDFLEKYELLLKKYNHGSKIEQLYKTQKKQIGIGNGEDSYEALLRLMEKEGTYEELYNKKGKINIPAKERLKKAPEMFEKYYEKGKAQKRIPSYFPEEKTKDEPMLLVYEELYNDIFALSEKLKKGEIDLAVFLEEVREVSNISSSTTDKEIKFFFHQYPMKDDFSRMAKALFVRKLILVLKGKIE